MAVTISERDRGAFLGVQPASSPRRFGAAWFGM
jgi:hypothetical protein